MMALEMPEFVAIYRFVAFAFIKVQEVAARCASDACELSNFAASRLRFVGGSRIIFYSAAHTSPARNRMTRESVA